MTLNDINTDCIEGKLLIAALAHITTTSRRNETPDQVLGEIVTLASKIYEEEPRLQKESKKAVAHTLSWEERVELNSLNESMESGKKSEAYQFVFDRMKDFTEADWEFAFMNLTITSNVISKNHDLAGKILQMAKFKEMDKASTSTIVRYSAMETIYLKLSEREGTS